jgi:hypothetical protein
MLAPQLSCRFPYNKLCNYTRAEKRLCLIHDPLTALLFSSAPDLNAALNSTHVRAVHVCVYGHASDRLQQDSPAKICHTRY